MSEKCEWMIRRYDPFFCDYNMVLIYCTSLERAFEVAVDEAYRFYAGNVWSASEYQIWHETERGWEMHGYIEWGDDGYSIHPFEMWSQVDRLLFWLVEVS